jgi:hypothetical protein
LAKKSLGKMFWEWNGEFEGHGQIMKEEIIVSECNLAPQKGEYNVERRNGIIYFWERKTEKRDVIYS